MWFQTQAYLCAFFMCITKADLPWKKFTFPNIVLPNFSLGKHHSLCTVWIYFISQRTVLCYIIKYHLFFWRLFVLQNFQNLDVLHDWTVYPDNKVSRITFSYCRSGTIVWHLFSHFHVQSNVEGSLLKWYIFTFLVLLSLIEAVWVVSKGLFCQISRWLWCM